jgi:hypothetical protein
MGKTLSFYDPFAQAALLGIPINKVSLGVNKCKRDQEWALRRRRWQSFERRRVECLEVVITRRQHYLITLHLIG